MQTGLRNALIVVAVALAMTFVFWWPLYGGAGFIGGDLYPYFFPQKAFYTDCLKAGHFPLWNDLTGFGYPVLGESQTGAAYPFHLIFYSTLSLNTAYNAEHLLHYLICFVGTWLFARRLAMTNSGACLTALVFTYGWFPPRACLEWAILTGAWLPVSLWCVESYLQVRTWRYAIALSAAIGLQLLAGHFHLAFITLLLVVTYSTWRLNFDQHSSQVSGGDQSPLLHNRFATVGIVLALTAGTGLAAVQLFPTWELKRRSSRVVAGSDYDPAYGHTPPIYVSQLIAPWCWYSPQAIDEDNIVRTIAECAAPWQWFGPAQDIENAEAKYDLDLAIQRCRFAAAGAGTNKIEAHCYCGLVPFCLAMCGVVFWFQSRRDLTIRRRCGAFWMIAGLLALIYATGWLLPIGRHLPGFSFFRGPGRYGIVTTLAVALFAGWTLSDLSARFSNRAVRNVLFALVFISTAGDLWLVSRMVTYTVMTYPPRIAFRESSEVRQKLLSEPTPPRLLAPGPNVCNMLGVSSVPWYLGIAPSEYVDPQFAIPPIPKPASDGRPTLCTPELREWLGRSGVTHVLNFEPLDEASWKAQLIWSGTDPFLNRVWGRQEPIYLYRFLSNRDANDTDAFHGRAYSVDNNCRVDPDDWRSVPAESRSYSLKSVEGGEALIVTTELQYPGWTVYHDGVPVEARSQGMFRAVQLSQAAGKVIWKYQPRSVYVGAIVSLSTFILLAFVAHMRFWHPALVNRVLRLGSRSSDQ